MEKLIQDKQYFKLIAVRNRLSGVFNRTQLKASYDEKDWLKQLISMEQIDEVITNVEDICDTFRLNRLIYLLHLICAALAFIILVIGIIINIKVTSDSETVKLYNFWDLSWPYFCSFFFIPMIATGLYFVNKYFLNKYEARISEYFADININVFEKQQVIWKIGGLCSYIDLSQISRLRSRSREINNNIAGKINGIKSKSNRLDEENQKGLQMTELNHSKDTTTTKDNYKNNNNLTIDEMEEQKADDNYSSIQTKDLLCSPLNDDKKEFTGLTDQL